MNDDILDLHANRLSRFKIGAIIEGRYLIHQEIGRGGFGAVYLVTQTNESDFYALKVLLPEHQLGQGAKQMLRREAEAWIGLERSAFIVRAHWIDQVDSELCIVLEFIPPDEQCRTSLADHLASNYRPRLSQLLAWSVHCCLGMEHAYSHGMQCHRDIKPSNVLISPDGFAKVTDFGLAVMTYTIANSSFPQAQGIVGTPPYMPPEAFIHPESVDERSDIYSFGIMLFEMLVGKRPFLPRWDRLDDWYALHAEAQIPDYDFPGRDVVERCLSKQPENRFLNFQELRQSLERVLRQHNFPSISIPSPEILTASDWNNKAISLLKLGRESEALECVNEALRILPDFAKAWSNKGAILDGMDYPLEECLACYKESLRLDPNLSLPWHNTAEILVKQGKYDEALQAFDRSISLDPSYLPAWNDRGWTALGMGLLNDAIQSFEHVLRIDPGMLKPWRNLAVAYAKNGQIEKALAAYDRALTLNTDAETLIRRGDLLIKVGRLYDAEKDFTLAINAAPSNSDAYYRLGFLAERHRNLEQAKYYYEAGLRANPTDHDCWYAKGNVLRELGDFSGAAHCYRQATTYATEFQLAWANLGACLSQLGYDEESLQCLVKATQLNPEDPIAWWNRAAKEDKLGMVSDATKSYQVIRRIAYSFNPQMVEYAAEWLAQNAISD